MDGVALSANVRHHSVCSGPKTRFKAQVERTTKNPLRTSWPEPTPASPRQFHYLIDTTRAGPLCCNNVTPADMAATAAQFIKALPSDGRSAQSIIAYWQSNIR